MLLGDLAHVRTGDKGNTSQIAVFALHDEDFEHLAKLLTSERIARHLGLDPDVQINRFEVRSLSALNFVLIGALKGGVTRSLALDAHGKTLGMQLLDLELEQQAA